MIYLLKNVSANTTGDAFQADGGCKTLLIDAVDLGGGSVTLEVRRAGAGEWVIPALPDGSDAIFIKNTFLKFDFASQGLELRAKLTGATNPSALWVTLL